MSDKVSPNRQPNRKQRKKKAVSTQISAPYSCIGVHKPLAACSRPELKQIALSVEVSRTGNKKDLIERIKPKLEQKLNAHRDLVKSRSAPLVAISGKRFLLLAKQHSVPVEPVTFQFVRINGVSADTLYKLGAKEHGDLMDQMQMSYNTYRSFIDFCFDIRDGEVVINVASANVEEEKQIGISEIGVLNDLNQINQLNDGNGISEIDIVNQNINENINANANAIEMQNVLSQLQERQPGAILKHTYVQPPPQPPTIPALPALPLPPLPLPPLPLPPPPPHDVGDVANDDPVWDSMLSVGMNTILCLPPPKYKATFKNKLARQALVGPTRVVEFSKFDQIKEKDKLNSILKILIPTGYCSITRDAPPQSELLIKEKEEKGNDEAVVEQKDNDEAVANENKNKNKMAQSEKYVRNIRKGGHKSFWIKINDSGQVYLNKNDQEREKMKEVKVKYNLNLTNSLLTHHGQPAVQLAHDCGLISDFVPPPVQNNDGDEQMDLMAEFGII
eukprot:135782_1